MISRRNARGFCIALLALEVGVGLALDACSSPLTVAELRDGSVDVGTDAVAADADEGSDAANLRDSAQTFTDGTLDPDAEQNDGPILVTHDRSAKDGSDGG